MISCIFLYSKETIFIINETTCCLQSSDHNDAYVDENISYSYILFISIVLTAKYSLEVSMSGVCTINLINDTSNIKNSKYSL